MALTREEIYKKVQGVMVDALGVDEEEVTPKSRISADLGAESIDYLDIAFRLEKAFTTDPTKPFKIPRGELFPENLEALQSDARFIQGDKITPEGVAELKKRLPFADFTELEKNPTADAVQSLLTVDAITNYVASKLG